MIVPETFRSPACGANDVRLRHTANQTAAVVEPTQLPKCSLLF